MDAAAAPEFVQRVIKDAGVKFMLRDRQQMELAGAPPSMIINDLRDVAASPQPSPEASVGPEMNPRAARSPKFFTLRNDGGAAGSGSDARNFWRIWSRWSAGLRSIGSMSVGFTRCASSRWFP